MKIDKEQIKNNKWLQYLVFTKEKNVNVERVSKISDINGTETLQYVLRTLDILESMKKEISAMCYRYVKTVLEWSEVAKGGRESQRKNWRKKGYPLGVHNLASAEIFAEEYDITDKRNYIIYVLIQTHGIIGQVIRGEVPMDRNKGLYDLVLSGALQKEELKNILLILNKCIVAGVSEELYEEKKKEIERIINRIKDGFFDEMSDIERLERMLPGFKNVDKIPSFYKDLMSDREFWYTEAALNSFSVPDVNKILAAVNEYLKGMEYIKHISFFKLTQFLYYDYEGQKKINIYKKRVIESFLKTGYNTHIDYNFREENGILFVNFKLTPACEKLIDFCVEAERSGILTYEKSITLLFDLFHFRRDNFDRLNNEDKYLDTMNAADHSTKKEILKYVKGKTIIDVGSGGGVMLNELEKEYPDRKIIGTDISRNVVDHLYHIKEKEHHHWDVMVHNFVYKNLKNLLPDTIIFSSILHEIYSYTKWNREKFQLDSIKSALKNAADSFVNGGRIIIRDGVKTDSDKKVKLIFREEEGLDFLNNFLYDFKGLPDIPKTAICSKEDKSAIMDINVAREFLYTYTWGKESYAHEVQEQFGYFTLSEICDFAEKELGMKIVLKKEFLEPGYKEHLSPKVKIQDLDGNDMEFPNSTYILVLEK